MKTKAEIITEILKAATNVSSTNAPPYDEEPDEEEETIAILQKRLPDVDLVTCEDLRNLDVECCEICHTFYPEDELSVVTIPGGRLGWVCCAIGAALDPERNREPSPVMEAWLRWGEND